jgi:hypothetical protein
MSGPTIDDSIRTRTGESVRFMIWCPAADTMADECLLDTPASAVSRFVPLIAVEVEALHWAEPSPIHANKSLFQSNTSTHASTRLLSPG